MKRKIIRIFIIVLSILTVIILLGIYVITNPIFLGVKPVKMQVPVDINRLYADVNKSHWHQSYLEDTARQSVLHGLKFDLGAADCLAMNVNPILSQVCNYLIDHKLS